MEEHINKKKSRLEEALSTRYPEWGIRWVKFAGVGLEMVIFRAQSDVFGDLAIRVPVKRWINNDNDQNIDSRELLKQEASLATHVAKCGISTPEVIALHVGEDDSELDFLVSRFVENDRSEPNDEDVGKLVQALHSCSPPIFRCVAQGDSLANTIAMRILRRAKVVERLTNVSLGVPSYDYMVDALSVIEDGTPSLLHMDIRPGVNLLTMSGYIVALIDWANALIGHRGLELARIEEYGLLTPGFLKGYRKTQEVVDIDHIAMDVCRLDTAIMLCVVFLSESPCRSMAEKAMARIGHLLWDRRSSLSSHRS